MCDVKGKRHLKPGKGGSLPILPSLFMRPIRVRDRRTLTWLILAVIYRALRSHGKICVAPYTFQWQKCSLVLTPTPRYFLNVRLSKCTKSCVHPDFTSKKAPGINTRVPACNSTTYLSQAHSCSGRNEMSDSHRTRFLISRDYLADRLVQP